MSIFRIVASIVVGVLISMPQTASAQKNIKIGLALPKGKLGIDFINGMYERFGSDVQVRTNGALTVEIVYGGALGDPDGRLNQMQNGAIQMSDAADGNYATVYPEIGVFSIPYLFATDQNAHKVLDGVWTEAGGGPPDQDRDPCAWMVGLRWVQTLQLEHSIALAI